MNWLTVLGYAVTFFIAIKSYLQIKTLKIPKAEKYFWLILSSVLFILIFNKLFNLQTFFTALGRCEAQISGWYDVRKPKQVFLISIWIAIGLMSLIIFSYLLRKSLGRIWLVLFAFTLNVIFILVRAVGFHDVDALLRTVIGGWRVNWIFEQGGIVLIIAGILLANFQYKKFNNITSKEK